MSLLVTEKIVIDPPFRERLTAAGLSGVAPVLACVGDALAAWSRTTDAIRVECPGGSFYIKRYHYPRWQQRFRAMLRGTFFRASRARSEYRTLMLMRKLGIQAVRPVAYGERRVAHFVRSCFLITETVPAAMSLATFMRNYSHHRGTPLARQARIEILTSLARQVRHMHESGFVHRDLFWRNVLIRPLPDNRFEFYFLDASVGRRIRFAPRQESIVHDIAAMSALAPEFCSKADQLRFLLEYLNTDKLTREDRDWIRRVEVRSDRFRDSEMQRMERGSVFEPPMNRPAGAL